MYKNIIIHLFYFLASVLVLGYGWKIWETGFVYNRVTTGGGRIATHAGDYAEPLALIVIFIGLYMLFQTIRTFYKK